jgi:chemotaxis protein methyltransferase WspC
LHPSPAEPVTDHRDALDRAQQLADDGDFDGAQQACQAHQQAHGPSARALHLMGLIAGARGQRARAEECFRKALYLDPDHEETLMHLALLLETKGEAAAGRVLRVRAQRHRRTAG